MSGQRCVGPPWGRSRHPIPAFQLVRRIARSASSRTGISCGLPMLTGPVTLSSVSMRRRKPLDQVFDGAEGLGLAAVAVAGDRLDLQRLDDGVGHHAAVIRIQ